jgi:Calx-beta domain-containing protein
MFRSLVNRLKTRAPSERSRRPARERTAFRPSVESLDHRIVPAAMLTIDNASVLEGNDGTQQALVTVRLTEPHGNSVTVNYNSVNGTAVAGEDYSAVSGQLLFRKNELTKTIRVPIQGDRVVESGGGDFSIRLSNAKGAKIAWGQGLVTIYDDEPRVYIGYGSRSEGNSGEAAMTFNLSLSGAYDRPVTVQYATTDESAKAGDDYTAVSGSWTFEPGAPTSHPIEVMIKGDQVPESYYESFRMDVSSSDSYAQVASAASTGTIYDDEPRITVYDVYSEGGSTITFWVNVSNVDQPVTVDFKTVDGTATAGEDYIYKEGRLEFNGEWSLPITIDLRDPTITGEYFTLQLSNASPNAAMDWSSANGYFDYTYYYDPGWGYYDPYGGYYW